MLLAFAVALAAGDVRGQDSEPLFRVVSDVRNPYGAPSVAAVAGAASERID